MHELGVRHWSIPVKFVCGGLTDFTSKMAFSNTLEKKCHW